MLGQAGGGVVSRMTEAMRVMATLPRCGGRYMMRDAVCRSFVFSPLSPDASFCVLVCVCVCLSLSAS